jgi:HlyD family secretion protein
MDVNENDIVKVKIGDTSIVEVDAYPKREFTGVVTEIANSAQGNLTADQVTNFKVKVRILESSYQDLLAGKPEGYSPFRPGMTATVDVITEKGYNVLAVPISSVVIKTDTTSAKKSAAEKFKKVKLSGEEEKFECVFIKDGNEAKLRVIKTGIQDNANIEVTSGLEINETVIVGPYNLVSKTLQTGDKVSEKKDVDKN